MNQSKHPTIDHYLDKVRLHNELYTAEILGREIIIYPNVMSPKYDRSSQIFLSMMQSQKDKTLLDIGCGTGIISVFAALDKTKQVVAVDINEQALENTRANFEKYNLKNVGVFYSDLFENISGEFDTIFFNAPFHSNKPKDILERGTSDHNYETLKSFFAEARKFLKENGEILFGFSNMGNLKLLEQLVVKNGLKIEKLQTQENGDWIAHLYTITRNR